MTTYYKRQERRMKAHLTERERREARQRRIDDWLDRAVTVDQIVGGLLIFALIVGLWILIGEMVR